MYESYWKWGYSSNRYVRLPKGSLSLSLIAPLEKTNNSPQNIRVRHSFFGMFLLTKQMRCFFLSANIKGEQKKTSISLVGGWTNPFEKYSSKWESSPSFRVKMKNIWVATTQSSSHLLTITPSPPLPRHFRWAHTRHADSPARSKTGDLLDCKCFLAGSLANQIHYPRTLW